ncbi:MAG: hypothetical protein HOP15_15605 [Planctomycetes bacterium]|nr:hypothetical protein [Planctomycetota bacterium]
MGLELELPPEAWAAVRMIAPAGPGIMFRATPATFFTPLTMLEKMPPPFTT